MANTQQASHDVSNVIAKVLSDLKVVVIGDLPAMPVSGESGNGFFCVPASVSDIAWVAHVPEGARATTLNSHLHAGMVKAQNVLKAYDKKNKDATDEARLAVAQKAFAEFISGANSPTYNESSTVKIEAERRFSETKVVPYAKAKGLDSASPDVLKVVLKSIIKQIGQPAYDGAIAKLCDEVKTSRTYLVKRKSEAEDTAEVDASDFNLDS